MGLRLCSSAPADDTSHLRFPAASVGSRKFGPYEKDGDGGTAFRLSGGNLDETMPSQFASQSELRKFLLSHVTVEGQTGATVLRPPGTLRGTQFIVADCEDCDIFLLDYTSTVSVDRCKNCRILIGPATRVLRD